MSIQSNSKSLRGFNHLTNSYITLNSLFDTWNPNFAEGWTDYAYYYPAEINPVCNFYSNCTLHGFCTNKDIKAHGLNTECKTVDFHMPRASKFFKKDVFVKMWECSSVENYVDNYLVENNHHRDLECLRNELRIKYGYARYITKNRGQYNLEHRYLMAYRWGEQHPLFGCKHMTIKGKPCAIIDNCKVEPTSGSMLKAIGASAYSLYQSATWRNSQFHIEQILERWAIEVVRLLTNFSISNMVLSFLSILTDFTPLSELLPVVFNLFQSTYRAISLRFSQQPDEEVEISENPEQDSTFVPTGATSLDLTALDLTGYKDNTPAIASALASLAMVFALLISAKNINDANNKKTLVENFAATMACCTKFKSGIAAFKDMIRDFSTMVYDCVFDLLLGDPDSLLVKLIKSTPIPESDECKKEQIFEYVEFSLNPANLLSLLSNFARQRQLEFAYKIFYDLNMKIADTVHHLPQQTVNYIVKTLNDLNAIRKAIAKNGNSAKSYRFCPFWINLVGASGTCKSSFMSILSGYLVELLKMEQTRSAKAGTPIDFELPCDENLYYFRNFCDKYETGYHGQYLSFMDDVFQDNNQPEISSALKMILYCSPIPYYTNQAALDDKGIPFTSHIVITSSNDPSMESRNEIKDKQALRNRINVMFIVREKTPREAKDMTFNDEFADTWFKKPVVFDVVLPSENNRIVTTLTPSQAIVHCFNNYVEWFAKEKHLQKLKTPRSEVVEALSVKVKSHEDLKVDFSKWNLVGHSSGIFCKLGFVGIKDNLYDCDCPKHTKYNKLAVLYRTHIGEVEITEIESKLEQVETRSYGSSFSYLWHSVYSKIKNLMQTTMGKIVMGAIVAVNSYLLWKYVSPKKVADSISETAAKYSISKPVRAGKERVIVKSDGPALEPFLSHEVSKLSYDVIYGTIVRRGLVCKLFNDSNLVNTAFRIGGRVILTNHHYLNPMKEGAEFEIVYSTHDGNHHRIKQKFNRKRMYRIPDTDVVLYECDNALQPSKNVIKHFIDTEVDKCDYEACVVTLMGNSPTNLTTTVMSHVTAVPVTFKSEYEVGKVAYDVLDTFRTNCTVTKGMSGSLLIGTSKKVQSKILGIQTCMLLDATSHGIFKPISQSQILAGLEALKADMMEGVDTVKTGESCGVVEDSTLCPSNLGKGSLEYVGLLPKKRCIKMQLETKIIPSLIHDPEAITQEPSVLKDNDERMDEDVFGKNVLFRAFEGFDAAIGSVDVPLLETCTQQMAIEYDVVLDTGNPRRLLSPFEMVNGIPQVYNRVEMKSSPGYPLVLERKETTKSGKYEWFNEIEPPEGYGKAYQMKDNLASGLEQAEKQLKEGEIPNFISYACLKDETRPLDKIRKGKTRAFICLPLIYNLLVRKYFGAFVAALHAKAGKVASCVGIDPATQWVNLFNKLAEKNRKWEDFDYANWDQHLHPNFVMAVVTIVNKYYGDKDDSVNGRVRKLLIHYLIFTPIIVKNRLFVKSTGQCSGCAITAELNSVVHDLLMFYVWSQVTNCNDLQLYRQDVAVIMYGDDVIKSVDPNCGYVFNGEVIKPYMDDIGMKITPGDKMSTEFKTKSPDEVLFLKRKFVKEGDIVKAPLRSDIVHNIVQWIHKSDNSIEATRINCMTALQEGYMHSRDYYESLSAYINNRIKLYNRLNTGKEMLPITVLYEEFDRKYSMGEFICVGLSRPDHM